MTKLQFLMLESCVVAGIAALLYFHFNPRPTTRPQQRLVDIALNPDADLKDQQEAVLELARSGLGAEGTLRDILAKSTKPAVREGAIFALRQVDDWESIPALFAIAENFADDSRVRTTAGGALASFLGTRDFILQLKDSDGSEMPEEVQRETIGRLRELYKKQQAAGPEARKKKPG